MRTSRLTALLLTLLFVSWMVGGCGSSASQGSGDTVQITKEAAGSTVTLKTGQQLEMVLEGNPSTGYEWMLDLPFGNSLKEGGVTTVANTDVSLVGAPSTYHFAFAAENPGETVLNFLYKRSWETTPEDQTITVTVVVQ